MSSCSKTMNEIIEYVSMSYGLIFLRLVVFYASKMIFLDWVQHDNDDNDKGKWSVFFIFMFGLSGENESLT